MNKGNPQIKPPMWAIDPGVIAYNCSKHGFPMPVLALPLWEGTGNKVYDVSGNINKGSLITPTWVRERYGNTLLFNGTTDYGTIPSKANLNFGDGTTDKPFSIITSVYISNDTSKQGFVSKTQTSTSGNIEWLLTTYGGTDNDSLSFTCYDNDSSIQIGQTSTAALPANQWIQIGMTYNGRSSNTGITLYKDGDVMPSSGFSQGVYVAMHNTTTPVEIGTSYRLLVEYKQFLNGYMQYAYIFPNVLTPQQMKYICTYPYFMFDK